MDEHNASPTEKARKEAQIQAHRVAMGYTAEAGFPTHPDSAKAAAEQAAEAKAEDAA